MAAADILLFLHAAFVAFVIGGLVALEALAGITCPLTLWEDALRGHTRPTGFVADWVARLLYWDLPGWVFIALYCAWAVLAAAAWHWVPPRTRMPK